VAGGMIRFRIGTGGPQTIRPRSPLPDITRPVVIDGTSQPGYAGTPLIELRGTHVGLTGSGLLLHSYGSIVRGLVINGFPQAGIEIGYPFWTPFPLDLNNSGIPPTRAIIQGNYIGTDRSGTLDMGNGRGGVLMWNYSWDAPTENIIGGTTRAERNVISGNDLYCGIYFNRLSWSDTIRGNRIGTNARGTAALGNELCGIGAEQVVDILIGGRAPGAGNLISGSTVEQGYYGSGILLYSVYGALVQGNLIGTDASGTKALPNAAAGITVGGVMGVIGGLEPGAGNRIAYNGSAGVGGSSGIGDAVGGDVDVAILGNMIFENGGLGIDGGPLGRTANDPGDSDVHQNYPVLASAQRSGAQLRVRGTLRSRPNLTYRVELFANAEGSGEGRHFLGAVSVTTDAEGRASFAPLVDLPPAWQPLITATASLEPLPPTSFGYRGTSEFSRGIKAVLE
jgi:hypothetical protein